MLARVAVAAGSALAFVLACGGPAENADSSAESALLPNSKVFDVAHDGATCRAIADWFAAKEIDLHVDTTAFAPAWPLADTKPSVINRLGTPIMFSSGATSDAPVYGYFSTGFDVVRSSSSLSDTVVAPHEGK